MSKTRPPIPALVTVLCAAWTVAVSGCGTSAVDEESAAGGAEEPAGPADWREIVERGPRFGLPGLSVAIDAPEREPWTGAAGWASLEDSLPLRPGHALHLASVTKLFTAVAVLRLVDDGVLGLDDGLVDLVDDPSVRALPHADRITVGHLLEHTSGLAPPNNDPTYIGALIGNRAGEHIEWAPRDFVDLTSRRPPRGEPGSGTYYGDTNYILLGMVVGAAAGRPYREHVRATLFEPLGLSSAYFLSAVPPGAEPPVETAEGYAFLNDQLRQLSWNPGFERVREGVLNTTAASERIDAAAGIVATARDLARFGRAVFRGDLLSPESRAVLLSAAEGLASEPSGVERRGIVHAYRKPYGVLVTAEGDGPGGQNTLLAFHPGTGLVVAALTNGFGLGDVHGFLLDEVAGAVVGELLEE